MATQDVFAPVVSYTLAATDASGTTNVTIDGNSPVVRLYNKSTTNEVFVGWGTTDQTVTATAPNYRVSLPPGGVEVFLKGPATKIAAICATGETATLRIVVGLGE